MNMKLTGHFKPFKPCALGKARKKNALKPTEKYFSTNGKHLSLGITLQTAKSLGGSVFGFWCLKTRWTKIGYFLKEKSDLAVNVLDLIKNLKAKHVSKVKFIHSYNDWIHNNHVLASQKLYHGHHLLNSLRKGYILHL